MKVKLLLSCVVLSITVASASWVALPCRSAEIQNIRLEVNTSSIRISNGQKILVTQQLCNSENNLVAQLNSMLKRRGGHFVVNIYEGELEFDCLPNVTPLAATSTLRQKIGALFIGSVAYGCINGLPPEAKAVVSNVAHRAYGEVGYSQATGTHIKVGICSRY